MTTLPRCNLSLARATLLYDWRKFLPAALSVTFAGVLMMVQLGLLMGMFGTVTVLVDSTSADLWVTAPGTDSVDDTADIASPLSALLAVSPEVIHTETLPVRYAGWKAANGTRVTVAVTGLSPDPAALACPGPLRARLCALLATPGGVVVDQSEAGKLGTAVGEYAEINGRRVRVLALSHGMRSIGTTYIFTSQQTLRGLSLTPPQNQDKTSFILASLRPEANLPLVQKTLQRLIGPESARVWTGHQLSVHSQRWWLRESGVGAGFVFSTLLGVIIAVVITSQSLRGIIVSQVREYATFRAVGVPASRLAVIVIEQAAWVGLAGTIAMWLLTWLIATLAHHLYVPFDFSFDGALAATALGLITAVGSGLLALRELYRLQPAELLR